jgi:hypothetical protein
MLFLLTTNLVFALFKYISYGMSYILNLLHSVGLLFVLPVRTHVITIYICVSVYSVKLFSVLWYFKF